MKSQLCFIILPHFFVEEICYIYSYSLPATYPFEKFISYHHQRLGMVKVLEFSKGNFVLPSFTSVCLSTLLLVTDPVNGDLEYDCMSHIFPKIFTFKYP